MFIKTVETKKNERANTLKEVKQLYKKFGFTSGMLKGSLAEGKKKVRTLIKAVIPPFIKRKIANLISLLTSKLNGKNIKSVPDTYIEMNKIKPVYEVLKGWQSSTQKCKSFDDYGWSL